MATVSARYNDTRPARVTFLGERFLSRTWISVQSMTGVPWRY